MEYKLQMIKTCETNMFHFRTRNMLMISTAKFEFTTQFHHGYSSQRKKEIYNFCPVKKAKSVN